MRVEQSLLLLDKLVPSSQQPGLILALSRINHEFTTALRMATPVIYSSDRGAQFMR